MSLNFLKQELVGYCKALYGSKITETLQSVAADSITKTMAEKIKEKIKKELLADKNFSYVSKNINNIKNIYLYKDSDKPPDEIKARIQNSFIKKFDFLDRNVVLDELKKQQTLGTAFVQLNSLDPEKAKAKQDEQKKTQAVFEVVLAVAKKLTENLPDTTPEYMKHKTTNENISKIFSFVDDLIGFIPMDKFKDRKVQVKAFLDIFTEIAKDYINITKEKEFKLEILNILKNEKQIDKVIENMGGFFELQFKNKQDDKTRKIKDLSFEELSFEDIKDAFRSLNDKLSSIDAADGETEIISREEQLTNKLKPLIKEMLTKGK